MRQQIEINEALTPDEVRTVKVFANALARCNGVPDGGLNPSKVPIQVLCDAAVEVGGGARDVELIREFWGTRTPEGTP